MARIDSIDLNAFLASVDRHPELARQRLVYFDGYRLHVLREGPPYCGPSLEAIVIREPVEETVLRDAGAAQTRDGKLLTELLAGGLSCSAAALGWIATIGFTGAAPLTGGSSMFLAYLSGAASVASTVQCVGAVYRVSKEITSPEALDELDNEVWYQRTALALDAISLLGAATAATATLRAALSIRRTTGKTMTAVLKGLTRQERRKLAEEAIRIRNPGISGAQLKAMVEAGLYPKRFTNLAVNSSVKKHLIEALASSLDATGSAMGGVLREAGGLTVGLARSVETYQ